MNFLVVIKFMSSVLGVASIAFGSGTMIGLSKAITPFYKNAKKVDDDSRAAEAIHVRAEEMLRAMGANEKDISSLDEGNLSAYYQIKKKQLDWVIKNKEWIKKMGLKIEDIIPTQYLFEKR